LLLGSAGAAHAGVGAGREAEGISTCVKTPGFIAGPFVPDARTGRAIFREVERAIFPGADRKRFPIVKVEDEGDHWVVFKTRAPTKQPADGAFVTELGGGQLSMQIDKCNGEIRQAAHMR
jgi:hypothetical protein